MPVLVTGLVLIGGLAVAGIIGGRGGKPSPWTSHARFTIGTVGSYTAADSTVPPGIDGNAEIDLGMGLEANRKDFAATALRALFPCFRRTDGTALRTAGQAPGQQEPGTDAPGPGAGCAPGPGGGSAQLTSSSSAAGSAAVAFAGAVRSRGSRSAAPAASATAAAPAQTAADRPETNAGPLV